MSLCACVLCVCMMRMCAYTMRLCVCVCSMASLAGMRGEMLAIKACIQTPQCIAHTHTSRIMPNGARSCAIITPPCIAHKTHTHTITHTYLTHHAQRCTKLRKKNTTMHSTKNTHKHKHTQTHTHTSRIMPNVARSCMFWRSTSLKAA